MNGIISWLYLFAVVVSAGLMFSSLLFLNVLPRLILFGEFREKIINKIDLCKVLNQVRTLFSLSRGLLPIKGCPAMRNKEHRLEASQMKFGRVPSKYIKESWGKLAFYLFSFVYYLYCTFVALIGV
ncbi:cornichon [Mycena rebaudengoi]|nr:cornichon [Mycena rebaudengoi]